MQNTLIKSGNVLYLVAFLEGAALMAAELLSAKIMAPYYGNSLLVWTSVFVCTLSGLALGYFLGARLSTKPNLDQRLFQVLLLSSICFSLMSPLSNLIMEASLSLPIRLGSLLSALVFLFPLLVLFGTVSPLLIKILTKSNSEAGSKASKVYGTSTFGGVLATVIFGFYFIPRSGIFLSILIASCLTFLACGLCFFRIKFIKDDKKKA